MQLYPHRVLKGDYHLPARTDVSCKAVRLYGTAEPPTSSPAPAFPSLRPSSQQSLQPHPPAENNALLWRELPGSPPSASQLTHQPEATSIDALKALNKEVSSCSSWRQLRAILHAHAQSMNAIHVSALVSRLAKVAPFTMPTGFNENIASRNTSPFVPNPVSSANIMPATHAKTDLQADRASRIPSSVERRALDQFMGEVSQLVSSRLDSFDARGLSNTLWAVAKLGFCPSHGLLQRFLFAAYVSMHDMQPQEVANLAWALATMRIHPGTPWTSRLLERMSNTAGGMRPQELASSTWAIQQLFEAYSASKQQQQQLDQQLQRSQQHVSVGRQPHQGGGVQAGVSPATASPAPTPSTCASSAKDARPTPSLELRYLCMLHTIQQSAEAALGGFKARELMMLLLSLHRLRQHLTESREMLRDGGQEARSMMASHHNLLVAALQGPQLTWQLHSLSPLDVCNLAGLVARDVKLQKKAAREGTLYQTWHMIMGQRAIGHLAKAVVADSQTRMEQYQPKDLLVLVLALSTMQAHSLSPAWLSCCARRIATSLVHNNATGIVHNNATGIAHNNATGNRDGLLGSSKARPHSQTGVPNVGCLRPEASPEQQAQGQSSLVSLMCGLSNLVAKARRHQPQSSSSSEEQRKDGSFGLDLAAVHMLEQCVAAALPRLSANKLAVVIWSLAKLQAPWSQELKAAVLQRLQQCLLPPHTSHNAHEQPSKVNSSSCSSAPSSWSCTHLALNEVSMLLWGVEQLQLKLQPTTAQALAHAAAAAASAATGFPYPLAGPSADAPHADAQGVTAIATPPHHAASAATGFPYPLAGPSADAPHADAQGVTAIATPPHHAASAATGFPYPLAGPSADAPHADAQGVTAIATPPHHAAAGTNSASSSVSASAEVDSITTPDSSPATPLHHAAGRTNASSSTSANAESSVMSSHSSADGSSTVSRAPAGSHSSSLKPQPTRMQPTSSSPIPSALAPALPSTSYTATSVMASASQREALQSRAARASMDQHSHMHTTALNAQEAARKKFPGSQATGAKGQLSVQDLVWTTISLCSLQARTCVRLLHGDVQEALQQALVVHARSLQSQQLSTLIMALGQAQAHPSHELLVVLLHHSLSLLPSLAPTHMSRLLRGLARLKYRPPAFWMAHSLGHAQAMLPGSSVEDVSWMLWSLAKLRVSMPRSCVDAWMEHLLVHDLYAPTSPRAAMRTVWALHVMQLKLPGGKDALLVEAVAQQARHFSRAEALWLLHVAVHSKLFLAHEDWGKLLFEGVLQGLPPVEAVAEMPLPQQHLLLSCMAHHHMRWTRCWDKWRVVHRALGGRHTAGGSGLVGLWRRNTRPRIWELRLYPRMSNTQRCRQRFWLSKTWEAFKASKPRQFCSIWKSREKYWDK